MAVGKAIVTWVAGIIGGIRDTFMAFINWVIEKYQYIKGLLGFDVEIDTPESTDIDFGADIGDIIAENLAGIAGAKSGLDELKEYAGKTIREIATMLGLTGDRPGGAPAEKEDNVEKIEDDTEEESSLMFMFNTMKDAAKDAGIYVSGAFKNAMVETVNAFKAGGDEAKDSLRDIANVALKTSGKLQKFMKKVAIADVIWSTGRAIMRALSEISFPKNLRSCSYSGLPRVSGTQANQEHARSAGARWLDECA